jgi:hypothetical protein
MRGAILCWSFQLTPRTLPPYLNYVTTDYRLVYSYPDEVRSQGAILFTTALLNIPVIFMVKSMDCTVLEGVQS